MQRAARYLSKKHKRKLEHKPFVFCSRSSLEVNRNDMHINNSIITTETRLRLNFIMLRLSQSGGRVKDHFARLSLLTTSAKEMRYTRHTRKLSVKKPGREIT
ncbi:hypothetical protein Baya_1706 [Bagarius yarrelli]|uniref:Uncharacterized protein n=1 Tax=Bagarius yarrelli TaxID=175774 RepID=A0A556TLV9_BAGYA|nr:hypothetical protein Baya_1706 [Bagarius yarrelli]